MSLTSYPVCFFLSVSLSLCLSCHFFSPQPLVLYQAPLFSVSPPLFISLCPPTLCFCLSVSNSNFGLFSLYHFNLSLFLSLSTSLCYGRGPVCSVASWLREGGGAERRGTWRRRKGRKLEEKKLEERVSECVHLHKVFHVLLTPLNDMQFISFSRASESSHSLRSTGHLHVRSPFICSLLPTVCGRMLRSTIASF